MTSEIEEIEGLSILIPTYTNEGFFAEQDLAPSSGDVFEAYSDWLALGSSLATNLGNSPEVKALKADAVTRYNSLVTEFNALLGQYRALSDVRSEQVDVLTSQSDKLTTMQRVARDAGDHIETSGGSNEAASDLLRNALAAFEDSEAYTTAMKLANIIEEPNSIDLDHLPKRVQDWYSAYLTVESVL